MAPPTSASITLGFTWTTPLSFTSPSSSFVGASTTPLHRPCATTLTDAAPFRPRRSTLPPHDAQRVRRLTPRAGKDFYELLGVSRGASDSDIKSGFRKVARKLHPDVNDAPDAKERFQEVARAYEVLSDAQQRQRYDQFGEAGVSSSAASSGGSGFGDFSSQDFGSFSDIFETFFGGQGGGSGGGGGNSERRRRTGPQQGEDLRLDVDISFEKAIFGGESKIRFSHLETCGTCDGSGVKPGTKPRTCTTCDGTGTVTQVVRTPLGVFQQTGTCATCRGTGEVVDEYCGDCGGRGRNQVTKQLMITIPPGVDTGSRLRIRNEGDAGVRGGPAGDLYVVLRVKDSSDYQRDGMNLYSTIRVSYLDAIMGRSVPVKTVDGTEMVDISAGTQPGAVIKLDGKAIPKLGSPSVRGHHFVTVEVKIPTRLSSEERALMQQLDELAGNSGAGGNGAGGNGKATSTEKGKKSSKRGEGFFNFGKK